MSTTTEYRRLDVKDCRDPAAIGHKVRVLGWVRTRREARGGEISFVEINDGSCLGNVQVVAAAELPNYETEISSLAAGYSVEVEGEVVASEGRGQATEIVAERVATIGTADPEEYPLQKKGKKGGRHTLEKLREWAHLRPRTNIIGAVARVRNTICNSIHRFFQEQGFLYVNTPIISTSDCEGAGELFQVTTMDLDSLARQQVDRINYKRFDFFKRPAWLTVSGQLEAETYACAMGRVYTFGPTFRAEKSNTSRHLAEFWMIEPEMAFYELPENMDLAEQFLKRIFADALADSAEDMQYLSDRPWEKNPETPPIAETLQAIVESRFQRVPYTEAVKILENSGQTFEFPVQWGSDLQSEHERYLTEKHFRSPVILYDYPRTIKPFYMYCNDDGKTVRGMDVLVPQIGEIIGGSQREHRLEVLQERMTEQQLSEDDYWWYLDLRRFGTVPHSGFGLGLERVVQFVTDMANIRDVIPFPRFPGNAEF